MRTAPGSVRYVGHFFRVEELANHLGFLGVERFCIRAGFFPRRIGFGEWLLSEAFSVSVPSAAVGTIAASLSTALPHLVDSVDVFPLAWWQARITKRRVLWSAQARRVAMARTVRYASKTSNGELL